MLRTISLTERRTSITHLHPEDVAFLLREHEHHLRLVPTATKHRYQLTPTHHVGVVVAPRSRLLIQPKLPLQSLYLLQDLPELSPSPDNPTQGLELLDVLTLHLLGLIQQRLASGLQQGYVEHLEQATYLRGRLDVPAHLRSSVSASTQFQCHTDQLSVDVPCNQILKATLQQLLDVGLLSGDVHPRVERMLSQMDAISLVPLTMERLRQTLADPGMMTYRPALQTCQWLWEGLQPVQASASSGPAFLINLQQIFERYVTRTFFDVLTEYPGLRCIAQGDHVIATSNDDGADLTLRPDVVIERELKPALVLDVKWKSLKKSGPTTNDLYQLITYCSTLGAKRGILLYPGKRAQARSWSMTQIALKVETQVIPVVGEGRECRAALDRILRKLLDRAQRLR